MASSKEIVMFKAFPVVFQKFNINRKFGLEIEMGNAISGERIVSAIKSVEKRRLVQLTNAYAQDSSNDYWHVKLDHSCGDVQGDYGWEIASFVARGAKTISKIGDVVNAVKEMGGKVNDRCALHVHVDVGDFTNVQLMTLAAYWVKIEPYFCHSVPSHRANNKYCKNLRNDTVCKYYKDQNYLKEFWNYVRPPSSSNDHRRKSLNLCNVVHSPNRRTVEFRFPESTLNSLEIKNWIRMFVLFVENVKSMNPPVDISIPKYEEFLTIVGLQRRDFFIINSNILHDLKIWFCHRILTHGRSDELKSYAQKLIDFEKL